jgi:hypothetical protein
LRHRTGVHGGLPVHRDRHTRLHPAIFARFMVRKGLTGTGYLSFWIQQLCLGPSCPAMGSRLRPGAPHPHSLASQDSFLTAWLRDLAACLARGLSWKVPPSSTEGAGNAGCALHPRPPVQQESTGVSNQGYTASAGIPCTMVLRLIRDLLGDRALLPPSPAVRFPQA